MTEIHTVLTEIVEELLREEVRKDALGELVVRRPLLIWKRRPKFRRISSGWPLGVLVLAETGELFAAGETTRAVPPKHPGHTSSEREKRRAHNEAAFSGPFERGEVVHFDLQPLDLTSRSLAEPLVRVNGQIYVRWSREISSSHARPLRDYLREQVDLLVTHHSRR